MSMQSRTISAFDETIFERTIIRAPVRFNSVLEAEDRACFFYLRRGAYEATSEVNRIALQSRDAVLKKCGKYVAQFLPGNDSQECEAVTAYFRPAILRRIYRDAIPDFLKKPPAAKPLKK